MSYSADIIEEIIIHNVNKETTMLLSALRSYIQGLFNANSMRFFSVTHCKAYIDGEVFNLGRYLLDEDGILYHRSPVDAPVNEKTPVKTGENNQYYGLLYASRFFSSNKLVAIRLDYGGKTPEGTELGARFWKPFFDCLDSERVRAHISYKCIEMNWFDESPGRNILTFGNFQTENSWISDDVGELNDRSNYTVMIDQRFEYVGAEGESEEDWEMDEEEDMPVELVEAFQEVCTILEKYEEIKPWMLNFDEAAYLLGCYWLYLDQAQMQAFITDWKKCLDILEEHHCRASGTEGDNILFRSSILSEEFFSGEISWKDGEYTTIYQKL